MLSPISIISRSLRAFTPSNVISAPFSLTFCTCVPRNVYFIVHISFITNLNLRHVFNYLLRTMKGHFRIFIAKKTTPCNIITLALYCGVTKQRILKGLLFSFKAEHLSASQVTILPKYGFNALCNEMEAYPNRAPSCLTEPPIPNQMEPN